MDIKHLREEYTKNGIKEENMLSNPFEQFSQWFRESQLSEQPLPNAVSLATADKQGTPSIRTVLLKAVNNEGFTFFTNYTSDKSKDITENPHVALLFFWPLLERQVIVKGTAEKVSPEESAAYFASRPYFSQLGAWCSQQSQIIQSRDSLDSAYESLKHRFSEGNVPYPEFWGGYRVRANSIEFWQGRTNRLHDRIKYKKNASNNWVTERQAP